MQFAAANARKHLGAAPEYYRKIGTPSYTGCVFYDPGLLDKKKKRKGAAKFKFDEAWRLVQSVSLDPLTDMIDARRRRSA